MGVYLRSNIWWVSYTTAEGKLVRRSADTPSKAEAEQFEALCRLKFGKRVAQRQASSISFEALLERCQATWKTTITPETRYSYTHRVKPISKFFAKHTIDQIDLDDVERCREELCKGRCSSTVNVSMQLLNQMLGLAVRWGLLEKNPANELRRLKAPAPRLRHLSKEEKASLLAYLAPTKLLHDLVLVALRTGMRRGELLGLKVCDVDLLGNQVALWQTKTNTPRHIPLLPDAAEALARNCAGKNSQNFVFTYNEGSRAGRKFVKIDHLWRKAVKACNLGNFRFHDLRHTFASDLTMAGAGQKAVSELLGHSTLQMTQIYVHLSPGFRQEEMAKLKAFLDR